MSFITEKIIEETLASFENNSDQMEQHFKAFENAQPAIFNWLLSDSFEILREEEQSQLMFMALTIWHSTNKVHSAIPELSPQTIEAQEEKNWELFTAEKGKFTQKLDTFFKDYPQEDLLAFVEDALAYDEDDESTVVTPVGREIIFVSLKSLIDLLDARM